MPATMPVRSPAYTALLARMQRGGMVLLDGGRVAADGTPAEVFRREVLERVYGWRLHVDQDPVTGTPRVVPLGSEGAGAR